MSSIRVSGNTSGHYDLTVPDVAGSNTIALDKIVVADSNGFVGVGTTTAYNASTDFEVKSTDPKIVIHNTGQRAFGLLASGTKLYIRDESDDQDIVTITEGGRVGIGTADPDTELHVFNSDSGATPTSNTVATFEGNDNTEISILGGSSSILALNFGHSGDNNEGIVYFNTTAGSENLQLQSTKDITLVATSANGPAGDINFKSHNTTIMHIDGQHNKVGIGITDPTATLDVKGDFRVTRNVSAGHASEGNWGFNISHATAAEYGTLYVAGSAPTGGIIFSPNNTQAMKIASNGNVSLPQQPSANAYVNSGDPGSYNYAGGANSVIIGSGVRTNVGNCYNNTNGRFTCPTAGRYFVSFSANFYNNGIGSWWRPLIQKNGSTWTQHYENSGGTWMQLSASSIVDCAAGDYLTIYNQTASGSGGGMDVGAYSNINFHKLA